MRRPHAPRPRSPRRLHASCGCCLHYLAPCNRARPRASPLPLHSPAPSTCSHPTKPNHPPPTPINPRQGGGDHTRALGHAGGAVAVGRRRRRRAHAGRRRRRRPRAAGRRAPVARSGRRAAGAGAYGTARPARVCSHARRLRAASCAGGAHGRPRPVRRISQPAACAHACPAGRDVPHGRAVGGGGRRAPRLPWCASLRSRSTPGCTPAAHQHPTSNLGHLVCKCWPKGAPSRGARPKGLAAAARPADAPPLPAPARPCLQATASTPWAGPSPTARARHPASASGRRGWAAPSAGSRVAGGGASGT